MNTRLSNNLTRTLLWLCSTITSIGCATDISEVSPDEAGAEAVGLASQSLSSSGSYELRDTHSHTIDLGSAVNRTCFLTGVGGSLLTGARGGSRGLTIWQTGVGMKARWELILSIAPETEGQALSGFARCVDTALNRTSESFWSSGDLAAKLGPNVGSPYRRCFLTRVSAGNSEGFNRASDEVRVYKDGDQWYIGGSSKSGVSAAARCVDFTADEGSWEWIAGSNGTRKDPLAKSNGDTTDCFLTGLAGRFAGTNDYYDGVYISYEPGLRQYFMNTKNGKTGYATCVR